MELHPAQRRGDRAAAARPTKPACYGMIPARRDAARGMQGMRLRRRVRKSKGLKSPLVPSSYRCFGESEWTFQQLRR
jgi:hypothetical protein